MRSVVIVGASAGGFGTAEALRREGFEGRIHLVDPDERMPYDRPPLSKQFLLGDWDAAKLVLRPPSAVAALDLDLWLGRAAASLDAASRSISLNDGTNLPFDELVIATGVRPSLPNDWRIPGVFTLRTISDAQLLRERLARSRRVVVVGAGFIGCEVAATCVALGMEVTIVDPEEAPMFRVVGAQLGQMVAEVHRSHGVEIRSGVGVADVVSRADGSCRVMLTDGSWLDADTVVVGTGSTPNTEWLTGSGLSLGSGIDCDMSSQAAEGIWGVGDVASWVNPRTQSRVRVEHRLHAAQHAQHVGRSIARSVTSPFDPTPYFWSDQYHLRIQSYGYLLPGSTMQVIRGSIAERRLVAQYVLQGEIVGVLGINMPKETRSSSQHIYTQAADLSRLR